MQLHPCHCVIVAAGLSLMSGCSKQTPDKQMVGRWTGSPNLAEEIDKGVKAAAQGKEVNGAIRGAMGFIGQKLVDATMSIEIEFQPSGNVFFRNNTKLLGLPADSDGTWQASGESLDEFEITFGTAAKKLHGKVLFRNKDEFTLKLDEASLASIATEKPKEEPKDTSKDGAKDGAKEAAKPSPKPPELDLKSIVFKRST
jgi:hypothetical protein